MDKWKKGRSFTVNAPPMLYNAFEEECDAQMYKKSDSIKVGMWLFLQLTHKERMDARKDMKAYGRKKKPTTR